MEQSQRCSSPANLSHFVHRRSFRNSTFAVSASLPTASSPRPPIQSVRGKDLNWDAPRKDDTVGFALQPNEEEIDWMNLESDIRQWTRALRPVQWYPGHIMKTEKELREQLKLMDVVVEVGDARIPLSTTHPKPANTKLSSNKTVRRIRVRGGNVKWRALRLDTSNYSWGSEAVTRKTILLDVFYNASNNELVRTKTLVKSTIVQVDAAPFKQWYLQHYGVEVGRKKKNVASATKEAEDVAAALAPEETKKSYHVHRKIQARQEGRNLD